jgi:hypothetical protein
MADDLLTELIKFDYSEIPEERRPQLGNHWRCNACGKCAADKYGIIGPHSSMWDESCTMHADEVPHPIGEPRRG